MKIVNSKQVAKEVLAKNIVAPDFLDRYDEKHRFYHNWDHIDRMIRLAYDQNMVTEELLLAIIFHDIIYDPKEKDNEEKSAELFYNMFKYNTNVDVEKIKNAILDTKNHNHYSSEISEQLCMLDLYYLYNDFKVFYDNSMDIFKEYQFVDFATYKVERKKVLEKYNVNPDWIDAVDKFIPKIGVYAGSFNPFHKGHLNILEKAERIFDKVIIARGINLEKKNEIYGMPEILEYRQIENYGGLLTDFIDSLGYDVTLIRGLRNATDLQYEMVQIQYMKDFKPDLKVVSLFCDKEFEHISSSAIRMLKNYNKGDNYYL